MKTELTPQEKSYLNEIFVDRLKKLKVIEYETNHSLALTLDGYREKIAFERSLIKSIKETIYNY